MGRKKPQRPGGRKEEKPAEKKFSSFDALRRAKGGATEPASQDEGPGWTLDTGAELNLDDIPEGLKVRSLERVAARPRAFGPMAHGPAPYRDAGSEEMQILHSFRCRTVFPDDVLAEVRARVTAFYDDFVRYARGSTLNAHTRLVDEL
jgi:hypothetical protein